MRPAETIGGLEDEPFEAAKQLALRLLSAAPRTVDQLSQRLRRAGFDPQVIHRAVERLTELGLLNDQVFAQDLAEKAAARGKGSEAIQRDLAAKGIPWALAKAVAAEHKDPELEEASALQAAERKARSLSSLPRHAASVRLARFLMGRGFDQELVKKVCEQVLGEREEASTID